jgi:spore coat protein U-like protein
MPRVICLQPLIGSLMRNVLTALLATGALLGAAGGASAANPATTTFTVMATVLKNCTVSAANLNFGNYTPTGGALAVNTTVSVSCTLNTSFNTELTAGTTTGATIAQRLLTNGTQTLQYNLYTTAGFATPWGTTIGTNTVAGTGAGMGTPVVQTVYGQLVDSAANQAVPPGSYTDTITVDVAY